MDGSFLVTNALILTMSDDRPTATSMLVKDGRIAALDPRPDEAGSTTIVDMEGRTLVPGLIDGHTHMEMIAYAWNIAIDIKPPAVKSIDDLVSLIAAKAAKMPNGEWILAQGMHYQEQHMAEGRLPDRYDLDRASLDHPIVARFSFHINVFNSKALEILGVDKSTPDLEGGYLERDANGVPNGRTNDMWHALNAPDWPYEAVGPALANAQASFLANGVTAITEFTLFRGGVDAFIEMERRNDLKVRVALYPKVPHVCSVEDALSGKIRERFVDADPKRLMLGGMKMFIDGGLTSRAAAMHVPYWGTDLRGDLSFEPEKFKQIVSELHGAGYQIAVHAIGDLAQDVVLDAYEALPERRGKNGAKHRIEHAGNCLWTDERAARFIELDVLPVPQPPFIHTTAAGYRKSLGPARGEGLFPMRKMLEEQGIAVPGNSDAIGIHPKQHVPMFGIWAMVTREMNNGERLDDGEQIDAATALRMYTRYAARSIGREHELGSLEPGKLADFVVFDHSPLSVDAESLRDLKPAETWINGELVFSRD
ncbi:amidohydrolase [Mesorhizobium australicum]|uniref:amidohydrolase n=1 Tax=Mesorhizobium australicum TaxID=536018 RepID=UPI00333C907C